MHKTPLYSMHQRAHAKMMSFADYEMPLHYGSQISEHEAVRNDAGMFDVSHMMVTNVSGRDAKSYLQKLITNDVAKLDKANPGKALYGAMLNHAAGVLDDLIVYRMPFGYRLVTNAGTRAQVRNWLKQVAQNFDVSLHEQTDFAILAVQGPQAIAKVCKAKPEWVYAIQGLKNFDSTECEGFFIARTGYTGEDGLEIMCPSTFAEAFWQQLLAENITPCGLAARDTLRLEAGMNLYGHDMDETINPIEAGLSWCVDLKNPAREFIGKTAILEKMHFPHMKQVGLLLLDKNILRAHYIFRNHLGEEGIITSGTFSPTLKQSIAIARVPANTETQGEVNIRGVWHKVRVLSLPFVRRGQKVFI